MATEKVFFHVDIDAFFASVEQLDNPEYIYKLENFVQAVYF